MSLLTSIPYSFRLHSGIKNVFQDPLVDNLETHRTDFFSSSPRLSAKTPWKTFLIVLQECSFPVLLEARNFAETFIICISVIPDVQSHLNSIQESRMSSKTPWRTLWRLKGECHLAVHLEIWNFAHSFLNVYTYHYWHSKSSKLQSGIKNIIQDSLEDALETQRRMPSNSAPKDLKFCTELP